LRGRRNGRRQRRGRRAGLGWSADLRSAVLSAASGQLGTEEHRSAHCDGAEQAPYFQTPTALPSPRCWILGTARVQTLGVRKVLPRLTHMLIVVFFAPRCLPAIPKCALELKVMDCGKLRSVLEPTRDKRRYYMKSHYHPVCSTNCRKVLS